MALSSPLTLCGHEAEQQYLSTFLKDGVEYSNLFHIRYTFFF